MRPCGPVQPCATNEPSWTVRPGQWTGSWEAASITAGPRMGTIPGSVRKRFSGLDLNVLLGGRLTCRLEAGRTAPGSSRSQVPHGEDMAGWWGSPPSVWHLFFLTLPHTRTHTYVSMCAHISTHTCGPCVFISGARCLTNGCSQPGGSR